MIAGAGSIAGDHLAALKPNVSFHIKGGPTAMPDRAFERVIRESDIALQICTAGNLRTALLCAGLAQRLEAFDRLIIGTGTPTGSGIIPPGMPPTTPHLSRLPRTAPGIAIPAAPARHPRPAPLDRGPLPA